MSKVIESLKCPYCGKSYKNLLQHLFYKHNMTREAFYKEYPNFGSLQATQHKESATCQICGKTFKTKSALGTHMTYKHGHCKYGTRNVFLKKESNKTGIKCLICGKTKTNIKQHVELTHYKDWLEYCKEYDYNGPKKFVSEETKILLSENKKDFYQSENGLKLKKQQSKKMKEFNTSRTPEVRLKISASRSIRTGFKGYGIHISFKEKDRVYKCRSFLEYCTCKLLLDNNISFIYDSIRIPYTNDETKTRHIHIADFVINDNIFELKPLSTARIKERKFPKGYEKYEYIKKQCISDGKEFSIVNINMLCDLLKLTKNSYTEYQNRLLDELEKGVVTRIYISRSTSTFSTFVETNKAFDKYLNKQITIRKF